MKFNDLHVVPQHRYALGVTDDGRHYLSIPVRNPYVEYEEYYALGRADFEQMVADPVLALAFAEACRRREQDALLIQAPGRLRGSPV